MNRARDYYPQSPEALIVNLARSGDRAAFEELVRRRQSSIRNLMRRCCRDTALADDLAQQVFLKVWMQLRGLRQANAFGGWLKRLAINVWLQHLRKHDALRDAEDLGKGEADLPANPGAAMDLDAALATLPETVRLCIVLSYQEGMSHGEIAAATEIALGTVKSHIKRGTERLRQLLNAYDSTALEEQTS